MVAGMMLIVVFVGLPCLVEAIWSKFDKGCDE